MFVSIPVLFALWLVGYIIISDIQPSQSSDELPYLPICKAVLLVVALGTPLLVAVFVLFNALMNVPDPKLNDKTCRFVDDVFRK